MASVVREGEELVVRLTALERVMSVHRDLRIPLASVRSVAVVDDPIRLIQGMTRNWKIAGGYLPGRFAYGTFRDVSVRRRLFAAVSRSQTRGLEIVLDGARYTRLILGVDDPETVRALLTV